MFSKTPLCFILHRDFHNYQNLCLNRSVSSFISKKRQNEIKERKIIENRRWKKVSVTLVVEIQDQGFIGIWQQTYISSSI